MVIYGVETWGGTMYLPTKEKALEEAKYSLDVLQKGKDTGYVSLFKYTVPFMTNELLCSILNSQGGRFAEEQELLYEWNLEDGEVVSKFKKK